MKRVLLIIAITIIAVFIIIQFFQPERNIGMGEMNEDIFIKVENVPDNVKENIKNACYDCHSNYTQYPWYSYISPISWYLDNHIRSGKSQLNFSEWGHYDRRKQISLLVDICEVTDARTMPLESYVKLHEDAELSDSEIEAICNWTDEAGMALLRSK